MDYTNSYDPTIGIDSEDVEDFVKCEVDGYYYPSGFMKEVEDNVFVFKGNLKEYEQILKTIAV